MATAQAETLRKNLETLAADKAGVEVNLVRCAQNPLCLSELLGLECLSLDMPEIQQMLGASHRISQRLWP